MIVEGGETRWVKQTKAGGADAPPEERGDCVAACFACILGFQHPGVLTNWHGEGWWEDLQADLAKYGHCCVEIDLSYDPPDALLWVATVPSLNLGPNPDGSPTMHCIVIRGRQFVHDPGIGAEVYDQEKWAHVWNEHEVTEGWVLPELDPSASWRYAEARSKAA